MAIRPNIQRIVSTLRVETEYADATRRGRYLYAAERPCRAFPRRAWERGGPRQGGVYIAVLGSALIIALLGMCALIGQRIENRLVVASSDIRQAQLNANTAVELAMLAMKQDTNWRSTYFSGNWFTNRSTGIGSCSANVVDPIDANLVGNADDSVVATGIGYSGGAEQRVQVTVDPRKNPYSCLRSAVAAGGNITLSNDILRTNGLTTANQITSSSSQVYGKVEATSVSGSTYNGTTTTVSSDKRPTMPDWTSVFNYYRTNGTQIDINLLPQTTPNLGLNVGIESGTTSWTGTATGTGNADISQSNNQNHTSPGANSLRIRNRDAWYAGASQNIESFVKPNQQYTIDGYVYMPGIFTLVKNYHFTIYTKGTSSAVQLAPGAENSVSALGWRPVSATITAPAWSGSLEYAFVKISGDSNNTVDFYFDDFSIRESTTGRYIYRQVLGPGINPFGGQTNAEGIYWINCNNSRLLIERSRIVGTLLVVNPGANSCVRDGPINWTPAVAGYPALLVDSDNGTSADFSILATNRALSEKENSQNFNQSGVPSDEFGTDTDSNDIYRSQIRGLIAVRHDLAFGNRSLIKGQIIVGNNIANSSGELEVDYQPESLLNPPPGFWSYIYSRRTSSTQKVVLP